MLTKEKVIKVLDTLPNEFLLDTLVDKLIVVEKIEIGLKQVAEDKTISNTDAKKKLSKYF